MSKGKCVDCLHSENTPTTPGGDWQGWCVFNPPVPALIIGQGPPEIIGGPPQQVTTVIAIRPPLTVRDGCASGFEPSGEPSRVFPN